jgi:F0F1-type ATP synthase membrane subunit c/vacuolar-type H+-ATPase subunit K
VGGGTGAGTGAGRGFCGAQATSKVSRNKTAIFLLIMTFSIERS